MEHVLVFDTDLGPLYRQVAVVHTVARWLGPGLVPATRDGKDT